MASRGRSRRRTRQATATSIFTLATGTAAADAGQVGSLAAEVVADAIVRAARQATGIAGIPAVRDLK